jgi:hypothetical protein
MKTFLCSTRSALRTLSGFQITQRDLQFSTGNLRIKIYYCIPVLRTEDAICGARQHAPHVGDRRNSYIPYAASEAEHVYVESVVR